MAATSYKDIKESLTQLYAEDVRPWLVGFSGGKDSTMLAKVEEYSESHRAHGLPDDLLNILRDDLPRRETVVAIPTIH